MTDPDFLTQSLRVTASGSCNEAQGLNYATNNGQGWQKVWSRDDSQLMFSDDNGFDYVAISTGSPIGTTGICTNISPTKLSKQVGYSATTPKLIYGIANDGKTLSSWDTNPKDPVTAIFDMSTITGFALHTAFELDFDGNDAWFCISNNTQEVGTQIGCFNKINGSTQVIDLATATENQNGSSAVTLDNLTSGQLAGCGIHDLILAPDGSALFIMLNGCTSAFPAQNGGAAHMFWQLGSNHVTYIPNTNYLSSHAAMGYNSVLINSPGNQPPCGSFSIGWKMWNTANMGTNSSPSFVGLTPCINGIGEQYDDHLSWLNNKNDDHVNQYPVIVMGEHDTANTGVWPEWEILAVQTSPALTLLTSGSFGQQATGLIWRLGHTWNDPASTQCSGMTFVSPSVSPDGKYVSYTSDWLGQTGIGTCTNNRRLDVFVLDASSTTGSKAPAALPQVPAPPPQVRIIKVQ